MKVITAPDKPINVKKSIFLAGGITDCPDWQAEITDHLSSLDANWTLFNPRRENFPIHDKSAAPQQIMWEAKMLRKADMILFWFPSETLCPIVLYELGYWSNSPKMLFVGCHPDYKRIDDVVIQTKICRPQVDTSARTVKALADSVLEFVANPHSFY